MKDTGICRKMPEWLFELWREEKLIFSSELSLFPDNPRFYVNDEQVIDYYLRLLDKHKLTTRMYGNVVIQLVRSRYSTGVIIPFVEYKEEILGQFKKHRVGTKKLVFTEESEMIKSF